MKEIGDNTSTYLIAVSTDHNTSVFVTKSSGAKASAAKNKVAKKESLIKVASPNDQIINVSIVNESSLNIVYGSVYSIRKSNANLLDGASGKI